MSPSLGLLPPRVWGGGGPRPPHGALTGVRLHRPPVAEWTTTRRRAVTLTILGCTYSLGQTALGGLAFFLRDWRTLQLAVSVPMFATFLTSWSVQCGAFSLGENIPA